jgi:hypothetical protein
MVALFLHHGTGSMDRYRKQWYCSTASNLRWCNAFILSRDKETECRRQNGKQPYSAQLSPNWLVRRRSRLSLSPTTAYGHGTMIFLAMMQDCVHLLTDTAPCSHFSQRRDPTGLSYPGRIRPPTQSCRQHPVVLGSKRWVEGPCADAARRRCASPF